MIARHLCFKIEPIEPFRRNYPSREEGQIEMKRVGSVQNLYVEYLIRVNAGLSV